MAHEQNYLNIVQCERLLKKYDVDLSDERLTDEFRDILKLPVNFTTELLDNLYKFIEKYNFLEKIDSVSHCSHRIRS